MTGQNRQNWPDYSVSTDVVRKISREGPTEKIPKNSKKRPKNSKKRPKNSKRDRKIAKKDRKIAKKDRKIAKKTMNKLHIYCYSRILYVIFYLKDCSQVRGSRSTMFYQKYFRFQLLKKPNASEFASASSFFLQSASASTKI